MDQTKILSFYSKRLHLRYITSEDAKDIFTYAKNRNVSRYTEWEAHKTIQDSIEFTRMSRALNIKCALNPFGIFIQQDGHEKMIGTVGLFKGQRSTENSLELGYALGEEWWGKGYTSEAANILINYAFKETHIKRIESRCATVNIGSFRVMEKLGMQREGTIRKCFTKNGSVYDMYLYSLLREEWDVFK